MMAFKSNKSGKKVESDREEAHTVSSGESPSVAQEAAPVPFGPQPEAKSTSVTQREGVFGEVMKVMQDDGISYNSQSPVKPLLNESALKKVYAGLLAGFQSGRIALRTTEGNQKKLADAKLLETYIVGLVNNWLRRDPRLNGKGDRKE